MSKTCLALSAVATALFALCVTPVSAHEYYSTNGAISQTNQWDASKAAPFTRDENDRFTP
jgi:hypothetical protein